MPRPKGNASAAAEPLETKKPVESDERADLHEMYYPEEAMDEEFEYEEAEQEIEELLEVEEDEDLEGEEKEEEKGEEVDVNNVNETDNQESTETSETKIEDEDEKSKHAKLFTQPPHGAEVYIGGIPNDASEEELRGLCESIGEVTKVQIMRGKDSIENKGFAFVTFRSVELASKAIDELHNTGFKGRRIKCSTAQARNRLFLGNVPRSWGVDDLRKAVTAVGPGITFVKLMKDVTNYNNNRGFAFIDYYNNACAQYSRQKMMTPNFKLGNNAPKVGWPDPKKAESSASSQVKIIYVKNLPSNVMEYQLKKLFEYFGRITKVVLPAAKSGQENRRIAFIHFADSSSATKALNNANRFELDGQVLECSLARPQADQKSIRGFNTQESVLLPSYPLPPVHGLVGSPYGDLGAGSAAAGFVQPLIYGGRPTAAVTMTPMLLPSGQIGYILEPPGLLPHVPQQTDIITGGSRNGSSSRGKQGSDGNQCCRYQPY